MQVICNLWQSVASDSEFCGGTWSVTCDSRLWKSTRGWKVSDFVNEAARHRVSDRFSRLGNQRDTSSSGTATWQAAVVVLTPQVAFSSFSRLHFFAFFVLAVLGTSAAVFATLTESIFCLHFLAKIHSRYFTHVCWSGQAFYDERMSLCPFVGTDLSWIHS